MSFCRRIDDALVDHVFQPICNLIRLTFGWGKRLISGIGCVLIAGCLAVFLSKVPSLNDALVKVTATFGWIFVVGLAVRAYCLFQDEFRGSKLLPGIETARVTDYRNRIVTLPTTLLLLLLAPPLFIFMGEKNMGLALVLSIFGSFCVLYFEACADLPKPPKKSVTIFSS